MHAWAIRVEDARNADVYVVTAQVIEAQTFSYSLSLVVARTNANGIHMPNIIFILRAVLWVTIDLARGRLQDACFGAFGQAQHVQGANYTHLGRLDGVELVMHWRRWACHVEDLIALSEERLRHVMAYELESRMANKIADIAALAREVIVQAHHLMTLCKKASTQGLTEKASTTSYQNSLKLHLLTRLQ